MVSASCESISARLALERSISARRVASSCSRRFISQRVGLGHLQRRAGALHLGRLAR